MKKNRVLAVMLSFCLAAVVVGCVTTEKMPEATENSTQMQMENRQEPEAAAEPQQAPPEDPCAVVVTELASQARTSLKTVHGSCGELRIEANPMWSTDYDGAVRVRTYDADGMLKSTEDIKP